MFSVLWIFLRVTCSSHPARSGDLGPRNPRQPVTAFRASPGVTNGAWNAPCASSVRVGRLRWLSGQRPPRPDEACRRTGVELSTMSVSPAGVPMPCQWRPGLTAGTPTSGLPAYESVEHDADVPHLAVRLSRPVLSTDAGVSCAPPAKSYLAGPPRRPWQQSSSPGAAAAVG